jgi:biotin synthase-related radical SAM superfamily protein
LAELIKVSSGTLGVLGLEDGRLDAPPTTAYLMVGGRCARDCGFCAQARSSTASALALSRVNWPARNLGEVLEAAESAYVQGKIRRCCLQATVSPGSVEMVQEIAKRLGPRLPVSASVVANPDQVEGLLLSGVERVGLSLDAVTCSLSLPCGVPPWRMIRRPRWPATAGSSWPAIYWCSG